MPNADQHGRDPRIRIFLTGHSVSVMGTKMMAAALLWHVYQLTDSAMALGALGAVELVPLLLLSIPAGVVADRRDRRNVLLASQLLQIVPAVVLGGLSLAQRDSVGAIFAVAFLLSCAQAFDTSARKALVPGLVPPAALARTLSVVDMVKNVAKLAGPALMGIIVAQAGLGVVYLINAGSFLAMAMALLAIGPRPPEPGSMVSATGLWAPLRDSIGFLRREHVVRSLITLDFMATFFAGAEALLPMVARDGLGLDASGYGLLASAGAFGALLGGIVLWRWTPTRGLGRLAVLSVASFALATIGFGLAQTFITCFVALAVLGAADTVSTVLRNTLIQLRTPDNMRGRISAANLVFAKSGPRLGQLEAGIVAGAFGASVSIVSGGILCLVALGVVAARTPALRNLDGAT